MLTTASAFLARPLVLGIFLGAVSVIMVQKVLLRSSSTTSGQKIEDRDDDQDAETQTLQTPPAAAPKRPAPVRTSRIATTSNTSSKSGGESTAGFAEDFVASMEKERRQAAAARAVCTPYSPREAVSEKAVSKTSSNADNIVAQSATNLVGWGSDADEQLSGISSASDAFGYEEASSTGAVIEVPTNLVPAKITTEIIGVSCGSRHTIAVTRDGLVYAWGWNALGQCGEGGGFLSNDKLQPSFSTAIRRPLLQLAEARRAEGRCVEVSAGGMHSAARFESGHVFTWGMSTFGQLGRGEGVVAARSVPSPGLVVLPPLGPNDGTDHAGDDRFLEAVQICCGGMHSAAVTTDGQVLCWGRADSGQLGIGRHWMTHHAAYGSNRSLRGGALSASTSSIAPSSSGNCSICWPAEVDHTCLARRKENMQRDDGEKEAFEGAVQVPCGAFHTACVTTSGRLFSWGKEDFGCLGIHLTGSRLVSGVYTPREVELPSRLPDDNVSQEEYASKMQVARVACGGAHTLVLDKSGRVMVCGKNEAGHLGLGDAVNRITLEEIPFFKAPCSRGDHVDEESVGDGKSTEIVDLAAGGSHSIFVAKDGTIYACGRTTFGRLGVNGNTLKLRMAEQEGANSDAPRDGFLLPHPVTWLTPEKEARRAAVSAGGQHSCVVYVSNSSISSSSSADH